MTRRWIRDKGGMADLAAARLRKHEEQVLEPTYLESLYWTSAQRFYASDAWQRLRARVLQKYGRRCMCCGATPATGAIIQVDHIKARSLYPELELLESNCQVLCRDCNMSKGTYNETDFRSPPRLPSLAVRSTLPDSEGLASARFPSDAPRSAPPTTASRPAAVSHSPVVEPRERRADPADTTVESG